MGKVEAKARTEANGAPVFVNAIQFVLEVLSEKGVFEQVRGSKSPLEPLRIEKGGTEWTLTAEETDQGDPWNIIKIISLSDETRKVCLLTKTENNEEKIIGVGYRDGTGEIIEFVKTNATLKECVKGLRRQKDEKAC